MAKNWKDIVEKAKEGLKELGDISVNEESPEKEKSEPKKVKNIPPLMSKYYLIVIINNTLKHLYFTDLSLPFS